jgi:glucosamine kinase
MIIIADSGSTKCDWQVIEGKNKTLYTHTKGINPFFHDELTIESFIKENKELYDLAGQVDQVFIYCAGGSNKELNKRVECGLKRVFINAEAVVEHDLLGAALSTFNGKPGITCILGTGSNSIAYDGVTMTEKVPALAYILGDEGSGSYFGKRLLSDYLYHFLPKEIDSILRNEMKITKDQILENVYMKPYANVYLASFMKLIHQFKDSQYMHPILVEGFEKFLTIHVKCFDNYKEVPVSFIGSVAFYFQDELKEAANKLGIHIGTINKKPIDGLVEYHLNHQHKNSKI